MVEKGRKELMRELNTQKAQLACKLHIYNTYGPSLMNSLHYHEDTSLQKPDEYQDFLNTQIDEINTKLYLLGQ